MFEVVQQGLPFVRTTGIRFHLSIHTHYGLAVYPHSLLSCPIVGLSVSCYLYTYKSWQYIIHKCLSQLLYNCYNILASLIALLYKANLVSYSKYPVFMFILKVFTGTLIVITVFFSNSFHLFATLDLKIVVCISQPIS